MKTYRVIHVIEIESFVDADCEEEALNVARSEMDILDGTTILDTRATQWADDEDIEGLGT